MSRAPLAGAARRWFTWIGLALMTASFIVLLVTSPPPSSEPATTKRLPEPFSVVILDPGHGGQDSGSMVGNFMEKDLTLDIARRVDHLLAQKNIATLLTRLEDSYISLADRAALGNRASDAIFVSIHCNDGLQNTASGVETFFAAHQTSGGFKVATWLPFLQQVANTAPPNLESQSLAAFIQQEIVARTHSNDRGTKAEQFYVLANVRHPAVLVETGFLTNKDDLAKLADSGYREQLAAAIASAILKYRETLRRHVAAQDAAHP